MAAYIFFLVFPSLPSFLLSFLPYSFFRRHVLRKIWPIDMAFLLFNFCRTFLFSLTLLQHFSIPRRIGPRDLLRPSPSTTFQNVIILMMDFPDVQVLGPYSSKYSSSLHLSQICKKSLPLVECSFCHGNSAISRVNLVSFVQH